MESSTNIDKTQQLKHSNLAIMLYVGVPIILYLVSAIMTKSLSDSINLKAPPRVDDFGLALSLLCLRIGSIVMFGIGIYKSFFTIPNESAARGMLKNNADN